MTYLPLFAVRDDLHTKLICKFRQVAHGVALAQLAGRHLHDAAQAVLSQTLQIGKTAIQTSTYYVVIYMFVFTKYAVRRELETNWPVGF